MIIKKKDDRMIHGNFRYLCCLILFLLYLVSFNTYAQTNTNKIIKTIEFSNLTWTIKDEFGAPGPNHWSRKNAWVDNNGWLHLKITKKKGKWYSAGVITTTNLGFGKYWFLIAGRVDQFDPNVVLGLFNYGLSNSDGTNEIDIEFSKWGSISGSDHNISYTVWPSVLSANNTSLIYTMKLNDNNNNNSIHGFTWESNKILYQSGYGHYNDYRSPIMSWVFDPPDFKARIPQQPLSVHIYLSLVHGIPPANGKGVEVIIKQFCYLSIDKSVSNCQ